VDHSSKFVESTDMSDARIFSVNPLVGYVNDFASSEEIERIRADLDGVDAQRSTISGVYGRKFDERRVAKSYKIPHGSLDSVNQVTNKVSLLFRLKKQLCEYPELIAYEKGGVFERHFDAALNGSMAGKDAGKEERSQRVFTAVLYLNDDFSGGTTGFPRLDVELQPQSGRLAFWQNTRIGGLGVHPLSMHEGHPVTEGYKQIISFWFRDRIWTPHGGD